ncbi:MAG TPA: hypothetical protein VFQ65_21765, partial [Kofleriaceae bacterium]|nr:hypothetical protein [Kofleriaceae bacterium]
MWRAWIAVACITAWAGAVFATDGGTAWRPVTAVTRGAAPVREAGGLRFTTHVGVVEHDGRYAVSVRVEVRNVGRVPVRLACHPLTFAAEAGAMHGRRFEGDGGLYGEGSPSGAPCEDGEPLAPGRSRTLERRIPDGGYAPVEPGHATRLWLSANVDSPRNPRLATLVLAVSTAGDATVILE